MVGAGQSLFAATMHFCLSGQSAWIVLAAPSLPAVLYSTGRDFPVLQSNVSLFDRKLRA